jgi:hypothetical protein
MPGSITEPEAVYRTDSGIRPHTVSAPAHTSRRLSGASRVCEFSVTVFVLYMFVIKPQTFAFVNSRKSDFCRFDKLNEKFILFP